MAFDRRVAQLRHHKAFVAAMRWVAAFGGLVVYLRGIGFLLYQAARWLAMCEQVIRRAVAYP
jgi:hypothetical protein